MNKISLFTRHVLYRNRYLGSLQKIRFSTKDNSSSSSSSDSSSSSSDDDKNIKKKNSEEALNKLNTLLKLMVDEKVVDSGSKLDLAQPRNKRIKPENEKKPEKVESHEKQVINAVQDVAEHFGGDVKQTESELILKLLNPVETDGTTAANLTDIVKGMKIDRQSKSESEQSRAEQVRQILERVQTTQVGATNQRQQKTRRRNYQQTKDFVHKQIDLFNNEPLGIFTSDDNVNNFTEGLVNRTWKKLENRELKLAVTHPPSNYFQQMILWTEQGKLWKFPIDNEQDLDDEKNIYFIEHVFLEKHLESWCPQKGPLRHFMELVCVGLSKNPYLTVDEKKAHLEWFRNYFDEKRQLLQDVGALPQNLGGQEAKQIV